MTQLEIDAVLNYRQKLINKLFEWQKLDHEEQERIIKVAHEKDIRSNPEALLACRNELLFLQKIEELFIEMVKTIQDKDGIEAMLTQFEEGEA